MRPLASLLAVLTGLLLAAANDWQWPALLLIGLGLASLAWTYYVRHRSPQPSGARTDDNATD